MITIHRLCLLCWLCGWAGGSAQAQTAKDFMLHATEKTIIFRTKPVEPGLPAAYSRQHLRSFLRDGIYYASFAQQRFYATAKGMTNPGLTASLRKGAGIDTFTCQIGDDFVVLEQTVGESNDTIFKLPPPNGRLQWKRDKYFEESFVVIELTAVRYPSLRLANTRYEDVVEVSMVELLGGTEKQTEERYYYAKGKGLVHITLATEERIMEQTKGSNNSAKQKTNP